MVATEILLMAAPFLLPFLVPKVLKLFSSNKFIYNTSTSSPTQPIKKTKYNNFRFILLFFTISYYFYSVISPPYNIFYSLAPPSTTLDTYVSVLRKPLDIRMPTEQLAQRWLKQNQKDLNEDQLRLLSRLQNLESRFAYAAYGEKPLIHCDWCSPPINAYRLDYFCYNLPSLALSYLAVLIVGGCMTFGDWNSYRFLVGFLILAGFVGELYCRMNWIPSSGSVVMLYSQLHIFRSLYFALISIIIYFLPQSPSLQVVTTYTMLSPILVHLCQQSDGILSRTRGAALERSAILKNHSFRERVNEYWSAKESIANIVGSSVELKEVESRLNEVDGVSQKAGFSAWLNAVMIFPPLPVSVENDEK